jgi:hypothetical protein
MYSVPAWKQYEYDTDAREVRKIAIYEILYSS